MSRRNAKSVLADDSTRSFHVVDVESLAGGRRLVAEEIGNLLECYVASAQMEPGDHGVVALEKSQMAAVAFGGEVPKQLRVIISKPGPGGGAVALAEAMSSEFDVLVRRYRRVVIGSDEQVLASAGAKVAEAGGTVETLGASQVVGARVAVAS